jgi:hypothetical protein
MVAIAGTRRRTVVAMTTIATAISCVSMYLQFSFLDSCVHSNVQESIAMATRPNQLLFKDHIHYNDKSYVPGEPVTHQNHRQRARILLGIFTADFREERRYRKKLRDLFRLHPRVCSLADFTTAHDSLDASLSSSSCEIIYTFVAGGNPNGPAELVDGSLPMLAGPVASHSTDFNDSDMTLLNIRYVRDWSYSP